MNIVERLKKKEEKALRELMEQHGDTLLRMAYLLVKDLQVAEEVVQDVFVTAYQKINQLNEQQKLKSWLITITMNECRRRMRKWSWKHIFLHKEGDEDASLPEENKFQPEEMFIHAWEHTQIHEAIQQLPYKYREVVTLFYFQEFSIKEIAKMLDEKENTIKTRLGRGRAALKQLLEEGGDLIAK